MRRFKQISVLLLLVATLASARKRDPLTPAEEDQIRDVAQEPYKRLKLYIKFTDARLQAIDQLRADPKEAEDRGRKVHDLLEDFTALLDEINSNLDMYESRPMTKDDRKEFHKGLKEVLTACDNWDTKLKALKSTAGSDPQTMKESQDYQFVLQDAEDSLKSAAEAAREDAETEPADDKPAKKK